MIAHTKTKMKADLPAQVVRKEHHKAKCFRNKCVFNKFLKPSTDSAFFMTRGRRYNVGATTAKARSPLVLSLVTGITKRPLSEDLRVLTLGFECSRSVI